MVSKNNEGAGEQNNPSASGQISLALTFPTHNVVTPLPQQPRQPRNLQGLLKFAMEATKAEDAPGNSQIGPMDEERRRFLEEALKSFTVDLAQVIRESLTVLTDTDKMRSIKQGQPLPDEVQKSFDNIIEVIDDLDISNDFFKMGGFAIFPICYGSENDQVRALASNILAELSQNNPYCQSKAMEVGLLSVLLNLIETEQGNALVKCLYAVSCICREYEPACTALISQGGCRSLAVLLSCDDETARTKVAFLVRYLCAHYPQAKEQFINQNIVGTISNQIGQGRDLTTEHMLSVLMSLTEGSLNPTVLRQFHESNLLKVLEEHQRHPDLVSDTFLEEKEYCQSLINYMRNNAGKIEINDEADR